MVIAPQQVVGVIGVAIVTTEPAVAWLVKPFVAAAATLPPPGPPPPSPAPSTPIATLFSSAESTAASSSADVAMTGGECMRWLSIGEVVPGEFQVPTS